MRVNTPFLDADARSALLLGYKEGTKHCFRTRCHVILLKSEGRSSKDVGSIVGMSHNTVNSWVHRYKQDGIAGLHNALGQGRKAIISAESDGELVKSAVKLHRQRVSVAQQEWESASGKTVSKATFRRFLKALVEPISVSVNDAKKQQI